MEKKKKKILLGAGGILLAAAVGTGIYVTQKNGSGDNMPLAYVVSVSAMNEAAGIQKMAGVVESQKTQEIQKDSEREVKEVLVKTGDEVDVGTPLFIYDTGTIETELQQAQLDLERTDNEMENLKSQISQLQKERDAAGESEKLSYTTQIQSAQMELKRSEFERKSKEVEMNRLKEKKENSTVTSEMKGVVKSIQNPGQGDNTNFYDGSSQAFVTILATGEYRVKGTVNEQNLSEIVEGEQAIIRSRVDEDQIWRGTYTSVDTQNPSANNNNMMYGNASEGEQTTSTSYHFYVNLESSQGLLLGQHVYIERDTGLEERKGSIWLDEAYLVDITEKPYVWIENKEQKLEKRSVILGAYDENRMQYEIQEGLSGSDYVAYPQAFIQEGTRTTHDAAESMPEEPVTEGAEPEGEMEPETEVLPEGEAVPEAEGVGI